MSAGRLLQPGDKAITDFNGSPCLVTVMERFEGQASQSGITFKVHPILCNGDKDSMYDADWFVPISARGERHE